MYIDRDENGKIKATYSRPQRSGHEFLEGAEISDSPQKIRDDALGSLVHDFGDGRIMQTRPGDESNIRNAIEVMEANSIVNIKWRMIDNVAMPVTSSDLQIALMSAQAAAMQIWDDYNA